MKELHMLINILDNLPNNNLRRNYLESIRKDPNIGRHDLLRLACNVLQESDFIESKYKVSFVDSLKDIFKKQFKTTLRGSVE
ncbi:hypothetical protein [Chryseobacterium balustinum]|uniref:Uncharacterized protein n=1 Tax=Chryseobacterium balustinum TaxID=246 RepID=A0ABY1LE83_9FLAO|nr:hypothetical protein [Chryseobacterium balustinum]SKB93949.1 hypothetical protein SAMN05421800_11556 [Chryseobacterium balustinum]